MKFRLPTFIWVFFFILSHAFPATSFSEKGVPLLENFTPAQYHNRGKIWDIRSAPNGIVYMAADQGLLEYDGKTWKSYKGSTGFIRSLTVVNDSTIYTGSDLDFGIWERDKYLNFEYTSLYPFQKDVSDINEEFWDVHQFRETIVFASSRNLYVYKNDQLTRIPAPGKFTGSFLVNDSIYLADEKNGLFVLTNFTLQQVFSYPAGKKLLISGIYHQQQKMTIVTRNNGLWVFEKDRLVPLDNHLSDALKSAKVFSFEPVNHTQFAFGTVTRGLFIADTNGRIIHQVNRHKGLTGNTILSLHYNNKTGRLWMGMDYGVSTLKLNSDFTYVYDYRGDFGTGYTALIKDNFFYLGTNQGLYRSHWDDLNNNQDFYRFELIEGSEGQVWSLKVIDNNLLVGHDRGLLMLNGDKIQQLSDQKGVWTMLPYKDFLLTGNYNGISVFRKKDTNWVFQKKMDLIFGSCNQLILEKENILWVNLPNFGIIRAVLDDEIQPAERLIFEQETFEGNNPYLIKTEKGIGVLTDQAQYTYASNENKFNREQEKNTTPKTEGLLSGIYQSKPLNPAYNFYPIYNGFALQHTEKNKTSENNYSLTLRKVTAFNNHEQRILYPAPKVPYALNNMTIEHIIPNQDNVLYQYKTNRDDEWSAWRTDNSFDLLNLRDGEYTFLVRAKVDGIITSAESVTFRIAPPWYRSWYAFGFYTFLLLLLIYLFHQWQKISLKKQKKALLIKQRNSLREQAEKHKQKIMLLEQEQLKKEYSLLKTQLRNKTIELANKAKDNEEKNRLLVNLKEKCEKAKKNPSLSKRQWNEMQRLLDSYLNVEDNTFEMQIDDLHQEFFKKLKEQFPVLSNNDLRLCAYLKIGLNSKEIAEILNIQPSSSYISRSRLRKKLNLKAEEDLYDFLNKI